MVDLNKPIYFNPRIIVGIIVGLLYFIAYIVPILGLLNCSGGYSGGGPLQGSCIIETFRSISQFYNEILVLCAFTGGIPVIIYIFIIQLLATGIRKLTMKKESFNMSSISYIRFHENSGKSYSIKLDSIKQIALFIANKTGKTVFAPGELIKERDFLLKNYKSSLPKKDYDILVQYLSTWVEKGGSFEIIKKDL